MNPRWISAVLLGTSCACSSSIAASKSEDFERVFFAMGTRLEISIPGMPREKALKASEEAYQAIKEAENRLSTWIANSELSRLNQSETGHSFEPSSSLFNELSDALSCSKKTDFAFNPWTGPLVKAWGLRTGGRIPSDSEITNALASTNKGAFEIRDGKITKNISGAAFEEGGFGKGVGLDQAVSSLKRNGISQAVLNFGGQLSVLGKESAWIEISNPSVRNQTLLRFQMSEGSVATSSNSEHGLKVQGQKIGHLLDASTGHPAPFEGSTTVIASTGAAADCMTKVFVMGPEKSLKWADKNSVLLLWITPAPTNQSRRRWIAKTSCAWKFQLEAISSDVEIEKDRCT